MGDTPPGVLPLLSIEPPGNPGGESKGRDVQETSVRDDVVQRAKDGDSTAFAELYEAHAPRLYRYFLPRVSGQPQIAEDLTEEVFVRVLERFNQYEDRGLPFGAWLFRIAHNLLIDSRRRAPKQPLVNIDECDDIDSPSALGSLDQALDQHELAQAMQRLTAEQQRVIQLRFLDGLTIADTANLMIKTEESVKKLQARALHAMRRMLAEPPMPLQVPSDSPTEVATTTNEILPGSSEQLALLLATALQRMRERI
ncbi:MAG: sigma-70 family RNA polymerase sigma factor [Chloroflexota bacterium]